MNKSALVWFALTSCAWLASTALAQTDWVALNPANVPGGRGGHAMAYDSLRDQIVLFGGNIAGLGFQSDTWIFDGTTWTQVNPATIPPARAGHPMAYDPQRGRCVMYGGIPSGGGALSDTWEWDGTNWILVNTPTSPPSLRSQPMVWHPIRGTVVMWGGFDGTADISDTWEYNGVDWSQIVTQNAPTPRRASDMAYDPSSGGLLLFSGWQQGADTWFFNGLDWQPLTPNTIPPQRYDHTMVTDELRGRVVMFGGTVGSDTWEWDGTDWIQYNPPNLPPARYDDYMVWDSARQRVIMFGGLTGNPDMWAYVATTPATFAPYGAGCIGTNGTAPLLSSGDRPWIGEPFDVDVSSMPNNSSVFLYIGVSNTTFSGIPLPLDLGIIGMFGCNLLTDVVGAPQLTNVGGSARLSLVVPNRTALTGLPIYFQAIVFDPGANPGNAVISNGGAATLGRK
jgi:hypothetical protein